MAGLIDFVIPRERKFFDTLFSQVDLLELCIDKLTSFSKNGINQPKYQKKILTFIVKKRDSSQEISKDLISSLHQTFITPIDRTEIKSLSLALNQSLNSVKKITEAICYFNIEKIDVYSKKQLYNLKKACQILVAIFKNPLSLKENRPRIEQIRKIEIDSDEVYRDAVEKLFNNGHDPIQLFKTLKLYEEAEDAIDKLDNIADIWESILINHA